MILKTGAIYTLRYVRWKTNFKIYAFILWPGGGMTKTHLLNLGAVQLTIIERARLVRTIIKLAKVPTATKYNGRLLYQIFKTYHRNEIKKCYRTFFTHFITQASLINYGLNSADEFSELELRGQNKQLFDQAQKDFQIKALNLFSQRGAQMKEVEKQFAGSTTGGKATVSKEQEKPEVPNENETKPGTITENKTPQTPNKPPSDDGGEFGY